MHLPTHLVLSWLVGHRLADRRERVLVAWAGVVPDLDAASALGGIELYGQWHHVLTHGIFAALAVAVGVALLASPGARRSAGLLALVTFHLHLACDLLGSGREWSITYLYPLSTAELFTPYGWSLGSWQNIVITAAALFAVGVVGVVRGRTVAEAFLPARADRAVVEALRQRFGRAVQDRSRSA